MAVFTKIRQTPQAAGNSGASTKTIDAQEINIRLGKSSTAELNASDSDFRDAQEDYGAQDEVSWEEILNVFSVDPAVQNIFGTTHRGRFQDPGGTFHGSLTRDIMASANDGGWYMSSSITEIKLKAVYQIGSNFRVEMLNASNNAVFGSTDQGWSSFKVTNANNGAETKLKSYGSFSYSAGRWTWSGSSNTFSTTAGVKRHIRIF